MWVGTVRSLPLAQQLEASFAAGCGALSITPYNYSRWLSEGLSTKDMLAMAADHDVHLSPLDPYSRWATHWRPDNLDPSQFPLSFFDFDEDDFFRIADALEVDSISAIITCPKHQVSMAQLIEGFAKLCDRASDVGLRVDLEFIPFWGLADLAGAWEVVRSADKRNSGIVFDFWHYFRGNPDAALLDTIPGDRISTVQITDADAFLRPGRSMLDDNSLHRVPPGEGGLPVVELLQQLDRIGGLNRVGPEIFSSAFDKLSAPEIGRRCRTSCLKVFEAAGLSERWPALRGRAA